MATSSSLKSVLVFGVCCAAAVAHPSRIVAQPEYVLVARSHDFTASVRQTSVRSDAQDARFVVAEVRYDGNRAAFKELPLRDAGRVRIGVSVMRVDCEGRRMFEQSAYYYDKEGNVVGRAQLAGPGGEAPVSPGSVNKEIVDWICARAANGVTAEAGSSAAATSPNAGSASE